MGAPTNQLVSLNRCSADEARLIRSTINRCQASVVSIDALEITEVAECGSAGSNTSFQYRDQGVMEALQLLSLQVPSWCVRSNACFKQAFIGVDISCTCHQSLVKQCGLDGTAASLQFSLQVSGVKALTERFWPKFFEASDDCFRGLYWRYPPHFPKAAHIDEAQFIPLLIPEADTGVTTRALISLMVDP